MKAVFLLITGLFALSLTTSCADTHIEAEPLTAKDSLGIPAEEADSINLTYTENAERRVILKANKIKTK